MRRAEHDPMGGTIGTASARAFRIGAATLGDPTEGSARGGVPKWAKIPLSPNSSQGLAFRAKSHLRLL